MKLPVFKVSSTVAAVDHIRDLGRKIMPSEDHEIVERGTRVELRTKLGKVEIDAGRGGLWGADTTRLWSFDPTSQRDRQLVKGADAEKQSLQLLESHRILPEVIRPFRAKPARTTGAITVHAATDGSPRKVVQEDTTVMVELEADVSDYGLEQKTLPIVGGGGRFSVTLGSRGRALATRGVWRPPVGRPSMHTLIPRSKTDDVYRAKMAAVPVAEFSAELAYYSAPAFADQSLLYPVYVYSGIANYQGNRVPLRRVLIPATEIGDEEAPSSPQPSRLSNTMPIIRPLPADLDLRPGQPLPPGIAVNRRLLRTHDIRFSDAFVDGPRGTPLTINPNISVLLLKELGNLLGFYSAGTSWIGQSGGLAGSQANARGFVDELAAIGWNIRFNWGDANAWESDWHKNDDTWVDAVDFAFYTGHANSDGWVLAKPDDTFMHFAETAGAADLWGPNNLEWMVVAACGPLQDELVGSGGDVLERWRNAFDGLHILMGYAQVTYDNTEEGKRLAQYAKGGSTIIQSWFRTGQEIQPGGIWAGAYYVGDGSHSTGSDHLWGVGSVSADVTNPTWRACSWVPC